MPSGKKGTWQLCFVFEEFQLVQFCSNLLGVKPWSGSGIFVSQHSAHLDTSHRNHVICWVPFFSQVYVQNLEGYLSQTELETVDPTKLALMSPTAVWMEQQRQSHVWATRHGHRNQSVQVSAQRRLNCVGVVCDIFDNMPISKIFSEIKPSTAKSE